MFCPQCGSLLADGAQFCSTCGAVYNASSQPNPYSATPQYGGGGYPNAGPDVPDYLVWNILATLFCCLPLGIVGIVFSSKTNGAKSRGDYATAAQASAAAKNWLIANVVVSGALIALYLLAAIAANL